MPDGPTHLARLDRPWPFTGRQAERAAIARTLAGGRGVLITGDPGSGKSRLLDEVLTGADDGSRLVLRATATYGWHEVPFGAFGHLVAEPAAHPTDLLTEAMRRVDALAQGRSVLVGVDDLNWLDDTSTALLQRMSTETGLRVVATVRTGDLGRSPVAALRRHSRLDRLDLAPFSQDGFADLITAALGDPADGLTRNALWHLTQGNPLLLRETLRCGLDSGELARHHGIWTWPVDEAHHPHRCDMIAETGGTLTAAELQALQYIARAGAAPLTALDRLLDPAAAESLEERGIIHLVGTGRDASLAIAHPLYAEVAQAHTGALRERRMLRELADALAQTSTGTAEDAVHVTAWRCEAGDPVPAADAVAAAQWFLARGDAARAARIAARADGPHAAWQLGRALVAQDRVEAAQTHLTTAYEQLTDPHERAEAAALLVLNTFLGLRQVDTARDLLATAAAALPPDARPGLLAAEAALAVLTGSAAAAASTVAALDEHPPRDLVLRMAVAPLRPYLLIAAGQPARAAAMFDSGQAAPPAVWPVMRAAAQTCHVQALLLAGQAPRAAELAAGYYRDALTRGAPDAVALLAMIIGKCAYHGGRLADARRWLREARSLIDPHTLFPISENVLSTYAWTAAQQGDLDDARSALDQLAAALPPHGAPAKEAALAQAWLAVSAGQRDTAVRTLREQLQASLSRGMLTLAAERLHLLARLDPDVDTARRLREIAHQCDSPLFGLWAELADGLARRDPIVLDHVATAFEERGHLRLAMEALAPAATAYQRRGDLRRANAVTHRIQLVREQCEGWWPQWHPAAPPVASALTAREQEVCELAASGLDNAAIAARLVLSVRTVENHLQRAYHKLGVAGRTRLRLALMPETAPSGR
ncbi:LuxR family transcriptional regulator [Catellatospora sp. IY07-71]|uniref:LuxR family transcriptional regulator n=1 Tax=Catellatospora sp. IY07-71 TaxID=2728827 RepID=UPI001BB34463|nr:LuxR family transcriptional regulator [Catellatospora sp. IY07-71]BCJ76940.1 LuxR family transcriptional regulator [Catellatospora sp. IY07-71]